MTQPDKIKTIKLKDADKDVKKIRPQWETLQAHLETRRGAWDRISPEQRQQWVTEGKDPILTLAMEMHKFLAVFAEGLTNG